MKKKMTLGEKQKRFCEEYLIDLNARQAAIRAGYSEKTATEIGYENLTKPHIQEYVSSLREEQQKRTGITSDRVLQEIAKSAFANIKNLYDEDGKLKPPHKLDDDVSATILSFKNGVSGVEEYKVHSKDKNLEMLGRHLGLFIDKQEITGSMKIQNIEVELVDPKT